MKVANPTRLIKDKQALSLMEQTTFKKESEDAYLSGLLWQEENPSLPNSYDMAKGGYSPWRGNLRISLRSKRDMGSRLRMTLKSLCKETE